MKTIVILSPRILLSIQQLRVIADDLAAHKLRFHLINLNSGALSQATVDRLFEENKLGTIIHAHNTTSPPKLREYYEDALKAGVPFLLISSTYDSAPRLRRAGIPVYAVFNDEAHHLVGDRFGDPNNESRNCFDLGGYQYSFTATQKITGSSNGRGMDNEELFGKPVYTKSPKALIAAGEMVPPAIHIVDVADGRQRIADDDYESLANCITAAYLRHERVIKARAVTPGEIGAKLLVTCSDQLALETIVDSEAFSEFQLDNKDVKVFALCSNYGILMNGRHVKSTATKAKELLFNELQAVALSDRVIIIHVDMLAEGLDVPGITGIMPFRNLGQTKFLQTLGRAARLHDIDRARLYSNKLRPGDFKNFVKPFAWVVIPRVLTNGRDAHDRYLDYIKNIRTEYKFLAKEFVIIDDKGHIAQPEELPPEDERGISISSIETFLHDIEDTESAGLPVGEFWHDELYLTLLDEALSS